MSLLKRALIVDDETAAREALRRLLAAHPEVEIVGEAGDVTEAILQFDKLRPNLIFLDVQMPRRDGFSLLPNLQPLPDIIFVTAYDCFAVKAFEVNAVDYLVKPIRADRLDLALMRLEHPDQREVKPFSEEDRIFLYADLEVRVVRANEISHIQAEGNYCRVHVADHKPMLVRRKMGEWIRLLPSKTFRRVNRSTIINLSAVRDIQFQSPHHTAVSFTHSTAPIRLCRMASRRLRKAIS